MGTSLQDRETTAEVSYSPVTLHLRPAIELTDDQLYEVCQINRDLRFERNAQGELIIISPTGGETGRRNMGLAVQVGSWAISNRSGIAYDSSTGFRLANGAMRSPDVSWILKSRLEPFTEEEKEKFIPLCPDFVIELRSPSDNTDTLKAKMQEYLDNGARLGLLIDPKPRRVYVYRPGVPTQQIENSNIVSCEPELPGFVLDLREIW